MKKVAILQSNYIPWKGYFDIINLVDEFILYDDMQYTRRDWRNRNIIVKHGGGTQWLTIPVDVKGKYYQKINETRIADPSWAEDHWKALQMNYARAPFFALYRDRIRELYASCASESFLSRVNYAFLTEICDLLGIQTRITWSSDYVLADGKTERLVQLVKDAGGDYYLSGPAAKDYIRPELFDAAGVTLDWMDYSGYPEYPQSASPFTHGVTVLDLLFNAGPDAPKYMKSFGMREARP